MVCELLWRVVSGKVGVVDASGEGGGEGVTRPAKDGVALLL